MVLSHKFSLMGLGRKRRVQRTQRGKGIGEFLASLGGGVGRGANNLLSGLFGGKRKRVVRRRPAPKRVGAARPKRRVVRRHRGRGANGTDAPAAPLSLLGKLNKIAKESGVVSNALNTFGLSGVGGMAKRLGYGRARPMRRMGGGSYRTIIW